MPEVQLAKEFLLTVAGFDPTGGAGILRDCATFRSFGFLGSAVITANTVQNTKGVKRVEFTEGDFLIEQLDAVLEELPPKGVKLGLPHREERVNREIARRIESLAVPVVFDPVLAPTFGREFVEDPEAIAPLMEVATVVTPNYSEFKRLKPLFGEVFSEKVVVVKGAPKGEAEVEDLLIVKGEIVARVAHKRDDRVVRGTGCAFSSALTALLAEPKGVVEAFEGAVSFVGSLRESAFVLNGWKQLYPLL